MPHALPADPLDHEITELHAEIARLTPLVHLLAMDTSAGISRGRVRSGYTATPVAVAVALKNVLDV